ncbi:MAG: VTC domain-containing protein [Bacteroidetes bacterium]|nr:VTC domain-containing protein [Bacteroidota bacterium]
MRYERKYRVEDLSLPELLQIVRDHPMSFRRLHPDRQVNNIYFDTDELHFFQENLAGVGQRQKLRLRWYGDDHLFAHDPVLEMKCKDNLLGQKFVVDADDFEVADRLQLMQVAKTGIDNMWQMDIAQQVAPTLKALRLSPSLLNTYQRSYYATYNGKFRLTIDRAIHSYAFNARNEPNRLPVKDEAIVVEIKYESEHEAEFQHVGQRLPMRVGKNSKYVIGMLQVGNV